MSVRTHPTNARRAPMVHRRRAALTALLLLATIAAGCTAGPHDDSPAPVVLVIGNINQTSDPFGDVISSGGTVLEDTIEVNFTARLKNPSDMTQPALQDVLINRYEVTFERTDGGTAVPAGFQRSTNTRVRITPHGQQSDLTTTLDVTIVPSTSKTQPPISHLIAPGFEPGTGFVNIQVRATLRFFGETVSGQPVSASATMSINFADYGDSNS